MGVTYNQGLPQHTQLPGGETLYSCRRTRSGETSIAKWIDGSKEPVDEYRIVGTRCNCIGSSRNPYCKHVQIMEKFKNLHTNQGIAYWGVFYDFDKDIFYVPEDGEGIPLNGAVDLHTLQQQEGKSYALI